MKEKQFVELVGDSEKSMNDALIHALNKGGHTQSDYEVLETISNRTNGKKHYQITLKVCLDTQPHTP